MAFLFNVKCFSIIVAPKATAARELSIPTIDIQHGVIFKEHIWYARRIKPLSTFYEKISPDFFLVWDHISHNALSSINPSNGKKEKDRFLIIGSEVNFIKNRSKNLHNLERKILFTCQYDYKLIYSKEELNKLDKSFLCTKEFIDWSINHDNFTLRFRLHPLSKSHPNERKNHINCIKFLKKEFSSKNRKYEISFDNSLEKDLSWCDVHVTLSSSVVITAAIHKIPSLILCPSYVRKNHPRPYKDFPKNLVVEREEFKKFDTCVAYFEK
mgnify:CR=1 FL=1